MQVDGQITREMSERESTWSFVLILQTIYPQISKRFKSLTCGGMKFWKLSAESLSSALPFFGTRFIYQNFAAPLSSSNISDPDLSFVLFVKFSPHISPNNAPVHYHNFKGNITAFAILYLSCSSECQTQTGLNFKHASRPKVGL